MEACMIPLKLLVVSLVGWGGNLDGVVLDFTAPWCGPCQQMSPIVSKLERQGLPIRKVDYDSNPDLVRRFNIRTIPAFVLVIDGVEQERMGGIVGEETLKRLCGRVPRQAEVKAVGFEKLADKDQATPARPEAAPTPRVEEKAAPAKPGFKLPFFGDKKEESPPNPPEGTVARANSGDRQPAPLKGSPLAASVRIRVKDSQGEDVGSGTIIDSRLGMTTVLTCGHIFRNWDKQATIEIDYFRDGQMETTAGRRVFHNLADDVGLISIDVDPLPSCRVASTETKLLKGLPVVSVGCSNGDKPTAQTLKITAINRYLGAENIEVGGMPAQGRSGGGLFTRDGKLIGVCSGADSHHHEGLYMGLKTVQTLLDRCNLAHLYRPVGIGAGAQQLAGKLPDDGDLDAEAGETGTVDHGQLADARSRSGKAPLSLQGSRVPTTKNVPGDRQPAAPENTGPDEGAIREALEQAGEAEVVCIIRPINQPRAASRVVILNRASRRFVDYLSDEVESQPDIHETTLSAKDMKTRKPAETQQARRPTSILPPAAPAGAAANADEETAQPTGPQPYRRKRSTQPLAGVTRQAASTLRPSEPPWGTAAMSGGPRR
jgi:thiol-disulfide isomerase/thioredoxin